MINEDVHNDMKTLREAVTAFNSILKFIMDNEPEENRIGSKYLYFNHPRFGMSVALKANHVIHTGLVYVIFTSENMGKTTNSTAAYGDYSKLPCIYMYVIKDNVNYPETKDFRASCFIEESLCNSFSTGLISGCPSPNSFNP